MNKLLIAVTLLAAAMSVAWSVAWAPAYGRNARYGFGYGRGFGAAVTLINAPGGAYIQCDPRSPSSPVRCTPDGW